ncbi:MAG: hypothetical protein ACLUD2_08890 [Clostridium sp.]
MKAIVIACNTATALTLDTVAAESDIPDHWCDPCRGKDGCGIYQKRPYRCH